MKWRFWAASLIATTLIAFAGAISGTLAWYEYVTRASVSYEGTSIFTTQQLQIGLCTKGIELLDNRDQYETFDDVDASIKHYHLKDSEYNDFEEIIDVDSDLDGTVDKTYYFVSAGSSLEPNVITNYLNKTIPHLQRNENGVHLLTPVTTKGHNLDDKISMWYRNPIAYRNQFDEYYVNDTADIHLSFRVLSTATMSFLPNQHIWLKDAYCQTSGGATNAMRLYFEGNRKTDASREDTQVLFNPSFEGLSSYDVTAGVLDLNGDGYYDCYNELGSDPREILYGIDTDAPNHVFEASDYDGLEAWQYNNINNFANVTSTTEYNTFYAQHRLGVLGYEDYSSFDLPKSYYYGTQAIYPDNQTGILSGGTILTSTSDDELMIADLKMKVYLEGWDHSIIDKNLEYLYNLGLTFQINKVE